MKTILYLLGFVVLLAAVYYFVFGQSYSTLDTDDTRFAIKNTEDISRITIKDQDKVTADLTKKSSGRWSINDRYYVREDAIDQIMRIVSKTKVYAPVAQSAYENVMNNMVNDSKTVKFYDGEDLMKTVIIAGNTVNKEGTYMMLEGTESPYITHVPGHNGHLHRFYFTNIDEWRTREAFDFEKDQITSISIDYPQEPNATFTLDNSSEPIVSTSAGIKSTGDELNKLFIDNYLDSFNNINVEAFDNYYSQKEEILKMTPYCKIQVEGKDGEKRAMDIYFMPINERSKKMFDHDGNQLMYDQDHFYAVLNGGRDFAVIQTFVFAPLIKKHKDFFPKITAGRVVN